MAKSQRWRPPRLGKWLEECECWPDRKGQDECPHHAHLLDDDPPRRHYKENDG